MESSEKDLFRVALVGCGVISGNHIRAILGAGQKIVALCDVIPERAKKAADEAGLSDVALFTDYEKMLDTVHPDSVHICTPHDLHAPMTVAALGRGIHVLCEKPLAISEKQIKEILEAEKKSTATLGVCHQNRYEPNMQQLKETVKELPLGGYANVVWNRDAAYYRSGAWRGTLAQEGGGVLINQALHTLDLMQWIFGMPKAVTAHLSNDFHQGVIEVEDTAVCTFEGENGVRWQFFATTAGTADFPIQISLRLASGELVEVQPHQFTVDHVLLSGGDDAEGEGKWVWGSGHNALIADFYDCIKSHRPFRLDGAEGAKVVRLILAAYRSKNKRVPIDE